MRFSLIGAASLLALGVTACSPNFTGYSATGGKPMGAASTSPNESAQMPQSPNSLPPGDAVSAPVDSNIGRIGTTRY